MSKPTKHSRELDIEKRALARIGPEILKFNKSINNEAQIVLHDFTNEIFLELQRIEKLIESIQCSLQSYASLLKDTFLSDLCKIKYENIGNLFHYQYVAANRDKIISTSLDIHVRYKNVIFKLHSLDEILCDDDEMDAVPEYATHPITVISNVYHKIKSYMKETSILMSHFKTAKKQKLQRNLKVVEIIQQIRINEEIYPSAPHLHPKVDILPLLQDYVDRDTKFCDLLKKIQQINETRTNLSQVLKDLDLSVLGLSPPSA